MKNYPNSTIEAKIITDSICYNCDRITTFQVRVPKWLLQEIARHRVLSLCFNSSRAIPAKTIRKSATYTPLVWAKNKSGMSAVDELSGNFQSLAELGWELGRLTSLWSHYLLEKSGLHKEYTNRVLEPYLMVDGVITATEWENMLNLRMSKDAQPDFNTLARMINTCLKSSEPTYIKVGDWHLPYITEEEKEREIFEEAQKSGYLIIKIMGWGLVGLISFLIILAVSNQGK